MGWEWVAPAATATVGTLSIFGTLYTGRQSRKAQSKDIEIRHRLEAASQLHRERQKLYADFLAAEQEVQASILRQDEYRDTLAQEIRASSLAYQIQLSAPKTIGDLSQQLLSATTRGKLEDTGRGPVRALTSLRDKLIEAMRKDLDSGYTYDIERL